MPPQLLVRSPRGSNKPTTLLHDASVFDLRLELLGPDGLATLDDLRVMTLEAALESASVEQDIVPFTRYLAERLSESTAPGMTWPSGRY